MISGVLSEDCNEESWVWIAGWNLVGVGLGICWESVGNLLGICWESVGNMDLSLLGI